jgi:hypothetical protein
MLPGSWRIRTRPVAFDEERKRCQIELAHSVTSHLSEEHAFLSMEIWRTVCPAAKVKYLGVEELKPEGSKVIIARATQRAKEAGIDVLPLRKPGEIYDFAHLRGKVVLIYCWSTNYRTSTGPMPEIKAIKAVFDKHRKDGFEVIGVNLDQDLETAKKAWQAQGLTWPLVFVPSDETTRKLWYEASAAGSRTLNSLIWIGRDGRLQTKAQIEAELSKHEAVPILP